MLRLSACQRITLLLEQRADQSLPRGLRVSVWLHLRYCPSCSRYAQQTVQIVEWARAAAAVRASSGAVLPEPSKERMRQRLLAAG